MAMYRVGVVSCRVASVLAHVDSTIAATVEAIIIHPDHGPRTPNLPAALVTTPSSVPPEDVVPFGRVPLMTSVSVPLRFTTLANVSLLIVPFPTIWPIYVALVLLSHPHSSYSLHQHWTGNVSLPCCCDDALWKTYGAG